MLDLDGTFTSSPTSLRLSLSCSVQGGRGYAKPGGVHRVAQRDDAGVARGVGCHPPCASSAWLRPRHDPAALTSSAIVGDVGLMVTSQSFDGRSARRAHAGLRRRGMPDGLGIRIGGRPRSSGGDECLDGRQHRSVESIGALGHPHMMTARHVTATAPKSGLSVRAIEGPGSPSLLTGRRRAVSAAGRTGRAPRAVGRWRSGWRAACR